MDGSLEWARGEAVSAFGSATYLQPWAFEYTPASSEAPDQSYLRNVRRSDVFLWLVGAKTTVPVAQEVREALASGRRIIAIELPAEERDAMTQTVLLEVGNQAKYASVRTKREFRSVLELTLRDEIIRAVRHIPDAGRTGRLELLGRESRARSIARWQSAGLSTRDASLLADDLSIGAPGADLLPGKDHPLRVLVGEVGLGKSLIADRLLQSAIEAARDNATAPVPVYLDARFIEDSLADEIRAKAAGLGNVRTQGAFVFVDGLDAVPPLTARLLAEARSLVYAWPSTRVVLTSRPTTRLDGIAEVVSPAPLTEEQAIALASTAAKRELSRYLCTDWSPSMKDAFRRPLFALLIGSYLRDAQMGLPASMAELLLYMTRAILAQTSVDVSLAENELRRLALLTTDQGGPVFSAEIGTESTRRALLSSGLIVARGTALDWSLPIVGEWFAAEAIEVGMVDGDGLAADWRRLDRWRYPLTVFVARGPHGRVSEVLEPIVRSYPGFGSELVTDSLAHWSRKDTATLPAPLEIAERVRRTTEAWLKGLGPVGQLVAPVSSTGVLRPIGVRIAPPYVEVCWYYGSELVEDVVALEGRLLSHDRDGWAVSLMAAPVAQPAWAWRWSLDDLRRRVGSLLESRGLPSDEGLMAAESVWRVALALTRQNYYTTESIPMAELKPILGGFDGQERMIANGELIERGWLASVVENARSVGVVQRPWPGPDQPYRGGWLWDGYSEEGILARLSLTVRGALAGYRHLVDRWFPRFSAVLSTSAMMPVVFRGELYRARARDNAPLLEWYLDPLPEGEANRVEIGWVERPTERSPDEVRAFLKARLETVRALRADSSRWISPALNTEVLQIFSGYPATERAYRWLWEDLGRFHWTNGMFRPHR